MSKKEYTKVTPETTLNPGDVIETKVAYRVLGLLPGTSDIEVERVDGLSDIPGRLNRWRVTSRAVQRGDVSIIDRVEPTVKAGQVWEFTFMTGMTAQGRIVFVDDEIVVIRYSDPRLTAVKNAVWSLDLFNSKEDKKYING